MKITKETIKSWKDKVIKHSEEINYARFREDYKKIPRGTVLVEKRVIWGFPHIPRIFTLEKGIKRNMPDFEVYIEEKVDGFNVRVAKINGKLYAFSRGGFLDPFVTEKVREMKNVKKFFSDYPNHLLCGEMIGNTPYTPPTKEFDVKFLVFDMDDGGEYLQCSEKHKLIKKYSLDSVTNYGKFKSIKKIIALAKRINQGGKEGMVIKSENRKKVVKYVVPNADIHDIEQSSHLLFDMPMRYFVHRVLRSSISIRDFKLNQEKYQKKLGKAFYSNLIKTLNNPEEGAYEEFEITLSSENTWKKLLKHMSKEVQIEILYKVKKNKKTRIRFKKIYKKTTKRFRDFLAGKNMID